MDNILIIGTNGIGKTLFIKQNAIPTLEKYIVIDFIEEYAKIIPEEHVKHMPIHYNDIELGINNFKEFVRSVPEDTTIITDNTNFLTFTNNITGRRKHLYWFNELMLNRKQINVFHSIEETIESGISDCLYDKIILFPVVDNNQQKESWVSDQKSIGKEVYVMSDWRYNKK